MRSLFFYLALTSVAFATEVPQSPQVQALSQKLIEEINTGLQCSQNSIALKAQYDAAESELSALKKQLEESKNAKH